MKRNKIRFEKTLGYYYFFSSHYSATGNGIGRLLILLNKIAFITLMPEITIFFCGTAFQISVISVRSFITKLSFYRDNGCQKGKATF